MIPFRSASLVAQSHHQHHHSGRRRVTFRARRRPEVRFVVARGVATADDDDDASGVGFGRRDGTRLSTLSSLLSSLDNNTTGPNAYEERRKGVVARGSSSTRRDTTTSDTKEKDYYSDGPKRLASAMTARYWPSIKFLGVIVAIAVTDVVFLAIFGSQTASIRAGMEWTRWIGTPTATCARAATASVFVGYAWNVWKNKYAYSSNTIKSYALACASYSLMSVLGIVVLQAAKVGYGLGSPWQLVGAMCGIAAAMATFTAVKIVQNVLKAAKAGRDSLNNETLSASADFASAVGTIKRAMAREFEKEMTRSVKKIENEMQKALEEKKRAEEKLANIIKERSADMQKMNTRIERTIDGKERGRKQSLTSYEEELKSLGEEIARMKATHESAMNAAQREFTEALEKERRLSAKKVESMREEQKVSSAATSVNQKGLGMVSEEDVDGVMLSKLQEEKDREIQKIVQALLLEKQNVQNQVENEFESIGLELRTKIATLESALNASQQSLTRSTAEWSARMENLKKQSESEVLAAKREAGKAKEDVKEQIATIEQKHAKELENAKESAKNADSILLSKVARVQQEMETLKKEHQENLRKLEETHKKTLEEAKDASDSSSAILVENLAAVQKQINGSNDKHKLEMEKMIQTKDALIKEKEQLRKTVKQLEIDAEKMKETIGQRGGGSNQATKQSVQEIRTELQDAMEKAKKTAAMVETIKNDSESRIVEARRAAIEEYEKLAIEEARIARAAFTNEINVTTAELERRSKQFIEAEKILKESSEAKKYLNEVLKDEEKSKLPKWLIM